MSKKQLRLFGLFEFLIRLLCLAIPLYLIIGLGISLMPLQAVVAGQAGWVLEIMGFSVATQGAFVSSQNPSSVQPFVFFINADCSGWKSMLFLFALIFAVPGIALSKRLWGLVFGLPVIWLGNIARVVGVVLAEAAYGVETALIVHDYLWQLGLVALVLVIWLAWMRWQVLDKAGQRKHKLRKALS